MLKIKNLIQEVKNRGVGAIEFIDTYNSTESRSQLLTLIQKHTGIRWQGGAKPLDFYTDLRYLAIAHYRGRVVLGATNHLPPQSNTWDIDYLLNFQSMYREVGKKYGL